MRNSAISGNGGAVYATGMTKETVDPESGENVQTFVPGTVNIAEGVVITGNSAAGASAIWLRGTLNMSGGSITDNTGASDGAVVVENHGDVINLSGSPVISDNTNRANGAANLYIGVDSDNIVNVVAPGLGAYAQIGITAMEGHMEIGELFAMAAVGMTDNLKSFVNDKYGYHGKLKDGTLTNVAWDGLELTIKKAVAVVGANANDRFTITLSSPDIKKSSYIIDGTLDYTVTAARTGRPGTIEIRNVKHGDEITISPLPVADYTISEAESNYSPSFAVDGGDPTEASSITFTAEDDKLIELTNTRRLADVKLTKKLTDKLAAGAVDFPFTVKLVEKDGTPVSGFPLVTDTETPENSVTTDENGEAAITMSPTHNGQDVFGFRAPVGAVLTITETDNSAYRITASALTMPTEGEAAAIEDGDSEHDNVFVISSVTDDGAAVTFSNERKMSDIELRKVLVGKVSKTESFELTVTLKNEDDSPAANFIMHEDADHPENNITADENGQAKIPFVFGTNESSKSVSLSLPIGTKLTVEEKEVKKIVNGTEQPIYDTTYSIDGAAAVTGLKASITSLSESNSSIVFTNTRKTQTVTVTNTVSGYSGNVDPFKYIATVTDYPDATEDEKKPDYDAHSFINGVYQETVIGENGVPEVRQYFELSSGQTPKELIVPYGAMLTIEEGFIVGYDTTVKRGSAAAKRALSDTFVVTGDMPDSSPLLFTNSQLIGLRLVNNTSSELTNVKVTVGKNNIYRVNDEQTGQTQISSNKTATLDIESGKTAILEIQHDTSVTAHQAYTVSGIMPAIGFYYTINNEPSFHEYANPAVLRVYDASPYEVKGELRYSVNDSIVTFTEQPLVSFDSNGGAWTTEMDGYHDRDGDRKVYQMAVTTDETVAKPTPDPTYPTAESIPFLGWTADEDFAKAGHTAGEDISAKAYDFDTPVTAPITLYAVWAKPARDTYTVTLRNSTGNTMNLSLTLINSSRVGNITLADSVVTDKSGKADITLDNGSLINLSIPAASKFVIQGIPSDVFGVSEEFTDSDSVPESYTIASVNRDGTVSFTAGVCKITDAAGNILYDIDGKPAVYGTLAAAFTAYAGTLYTDASHMTGATQACVKMLVDEYTIQETTPITFPNKTMTLTTAGSGDASFPYVGVRERGTIYRSTAGAANNCFKVTDANGNITLSNIVLDGGSERGVKISSGTSGGLIRVEAGTLNITTGTSMCNCEFADYSNGNFGVGGAIYVKGGTLNVSAGLFSNLHARRGGAICCDNSGKLNITGTGIRFENCDANHASTTAADSDGGAIYYSNSNAGLTIDGGADENNPEPGIVFVSCVARGNTDAIGDNKNKSSGGAIYVTTSGSMPVSISGCSFTECSARTTETSNASNGGGAICANNVKGLTVSYCEFVSCDTMSRGGAIVVWIANGETVSILDSSFEKCNCKGQGGGVAVYQNGQEGASPSSTGRVTKLVVDGCSFASCSSGTDNGSGGAIQSYVPCMEFSNSTFTDCWAGKEGGAVNNYFSNGYINMWDGSYMNLTNCEFTRCRAEDRYEVTSVVHYGGAINTKVKTVSVSDSSFTDCVSTLQDGGALHLGGCGAGSTATITGSTFTNCSAKKHGGAVFSSAATLTVSNSYFYGCVSTADNGGAIYHGLNCRMENNKKVETSITGCTFSAAASGNSCGAAQNGGAIWSSAKAVKIENCTIDSSTARSGGAVYFSKTDYQTKLATVGGIRNVQTGQTEITIPDSSGTITGGSIKNCQAVSGSAVYVGNQATFSGNLEVSGNTVSGANSGAIQTVNAGKLYFEGNVKVEDNTSSAEADDHDVLMQIDGNTIINTTSVGLGSEAHIGVYVSDPNNAYANHGQYSQPFGTYYNSDAGSNFLDAFFNDRNGELYGYQGTGDLFIHWGFYVCKITDAAGNTLTRTNGRDAIYQQLQLAVDEFVTVTGGEPIYIKMLVENYAVRQTEAVSNFPAADITLTTETYTGTQAVTGEYDGKHPYRGTEGTVSTINRANSENPLFSVSTEKAFKLQNITLDGRKDKTAATGDYKLITADAGEIVVNSGTTLQYAKGDNGAAITGVKVTINGSYDTENKEPTVKITNCAATGNGGAISAQSLTITNSSDDEDEYGSTFVSCTAAGNGGAICVSGTAVSMTGASFTDCHSTGEGGVLSHGYTGTDEAVTAITNCAFKNGYSENGAGGAVSSNADTLTVDASSFDACTAAGNGGAINHTESSTATITATTFKDCETSGTGTNNDEGFGGSVYTGAETVTLTGVSFRNSTAANHGGALYCASSAEGSAATVTGTSFETCSVSIADGAGGAIYSKTKALTLQDYKPEDSATATKTTINACTAPGSSGAVYMETVGSILNVTGNTKISGCYADKGGAIYLKSGVTMNLTGGVPTGAENEKLDTPEFTLNGYTTQNGSIVEATDGACIYLAEGSRINLSGNLKFSRNILPNQDRITNGGITDYVRQDIFLAGYSGVNAASIYIVGELPGDTIWVWPEMSPHKLAGEQFAKIGNTGVSADSLSHFRNALPDRVTNCSNGEYLAGVYHEGDYQNAYWDKMYTVTFKKIDNKTVAVPGAGFTLYSDSDCTIPVATAKSADGENDTDAQGKLLNKGYVEFSSIRIGVYYMKETNVPTSYRENNATYLVLVGSPNLQPSAENPSEIWTSGALAVENAATLVAQNTTNAGMYYGIFPLDEDGKAVLRANLASMSVGLQNIRSDYQVRFMKVDGDHNPLPGAAFTIYTAVLDTSGNPTVYEDGYPQLMLWSRDGETYPAPAVSANGTTDKDKDNNILPKGMVYFRELPIGTYYLLETEYPIRNGNKHRAFYVESDRVFKLVVEETDEGTGEISFTLSEWNEETKKYTELTKNGEGLYLLPNVEAVCKLTDADDNLLYTKGHKVYGRSTSEVAEARLFPAIYPTLEEGFAAAQKGSFVDANGNAVNPSALKLQVLKDCTLKKAVVYSNSSRKLTFTTAVTTPSKDRYIFSTNRTSDTSRALITRGYDAADNAGALIVIGTAAEGQEPKSADLTLQNIKLDGVKSVHTGRAIHVVSGSLSILDKTLLENFIVNGDGSNDAKGGAVLLEDGTTLSIDGGYYRTAEFADNSVDNQLSTGEHLGAEGGAISVGAKCTFSITNAQFRDNSATAAADNKGNGGAISINETKDAGQQEDVQFHNVVFRDNTATYKGGAIRTAENCDLTVQNCIFEINKVTGYGGEGGAIAVLSKEGENASSLTITSGTRFTGNTAVKGSGGAVRIGGYGTLTLNNMTMSGNEAASGGAVSVAPSAELTFSRGSITGNSAALGSAFYAENAADAGNATKVTVIGGSITGNKASDPDGGAINVGGANTRLYFGGSPFIFDNFSDEKNDTQQRNVVLGEDSNGIINTEDSGLTDGLIGVYVTGTFTDEQFLEHGIPGAPFGSFGDSGKMNPQVFRNDRALALYGVERDGDGLIRWNEPICKLTDKEGVLLYCDLTITINGTKRTLKVPAVYTAIQDGFDAAQGTLYTRTYDENGEIVYTGYSDNDLNLDNLELKMLRDATLTDQLFQDSDAYGVMYKGERKVVFTTAETEISDTPADEDCFTFASIRTDANGIATIDRDFEALCMLYVLGNELTLNKITLDGKNYYGTTAILGGIALVADGASLRIEDDATLQNASSSLTGGAVHVSSGSSVTMTGGTISGNSAAYGGAVYVANGAAMTLSGGTINGNRSTGNGAGIYLAYTGANNHATLYLSGNPYFGGTGEVGGELVKSYTDDNGNIVSTGNFSTSATTDLPTDAKNGGKQYLYARQDIFLADNSDTQPASIVITGDLTGDDGTIWVWAEQDYHYKQLMPFAKLGTGVTGGNLKMFRDARTDKETGNSTSTYLYGTNEGETEGYVYWSGVKGSRTVILRKVSGPADGSTASSLAGMTFNVCRHGETDPYVVKHELRNAAGEVIASSVETLSNLHLISGATGVFWVGELPYGEYDIEEVGVGWFLLFVGDKMDDTPLPDGYKISKRQSQQADLDNPDIW